MGSPFDTQFEQPVQQEAIVLDRPEVKPTMGQVRELWSTAKNLESQARMAKRTRNHAWALKISDLSKKCVAILWDFTKKAVLIAVFNFIVDFCAQILSTAGDALSKHKTAAGRLPQPSTQSFAADPFTRHYGNTQVSW